jgi:uncharacterized protein YdaU (DUF1376 family)
MLIGGRMNYVQLHLGDWIAGTLDLTPTERGVYMDLLVRYYKEERPLMQDECKRIARGYAPAEQEAMHYVLQRFFTLENGEYRQSRCDEEIEKAQTVSNKRKRAAASRWAKKPEIDASAYPNAEQMQCECNANGMLTNNQEPITNKETERKKKEKRQAITHAFRLDLLPSEWADYSKQVRPDLDPQTVFADFVFYFTKGRGAGELRSDKGWNQSWQGWVRRQKGPRNAKPAAVEEFSDDRYADAMNPDGSLNWG